MCSMGLHVLYGCMFRIACVVRMFQIACVVWLYVRIRVLYVCFRLHVLYGCMLGIVCCMAVFCGLHVLCGCVFRIACVVQWRIQHRAYQAYAPPPILGENIALSCIFLNKVKLTPIFQPKCGLRPLLLHILDPPLLYG